MADDIFDDVLSDIDKGAFDPSAKPPAAALLPETEEPDFLSGAIEDIGGQADAMRGMAVLKAKVAEPDRYADDKSLADRFGVDVPFARRNKDVLDSQAAQEDLATLLSSNPEVGDWYQKDDNVAAIKTDELRHLSGLNWLWKSGVQSFSEGSQTVELANLRYKQLMNTASGMDVLRADAMGAGREARTFGADTWMQKGWTGMLQQLPIMANTILGGLDEAAVGAFAGAGTALVAGQLGPQIAAPEEVFTVPAATQIGARIGYGIGSWEAGFRLEAGLAYDEFKSFKDENGNKLDDDVAKVAAIVAGGASSVFEVYGLKKLAELVPGVDKAMGVVGTEGVKWALNQPPIRKALANYATNIFKAGATEITTEMAQEAIVMFAGEVSKLTSNMSGATEFTKMSAGEMASRLGDAAVQTAQTMTILGPVLAGSRLGVDVRRARDADMDARIIEALNHHAETDELRARLPEKSEDAVDELTKNGNTQNVYVDPDAMRELFQTSGESMDEFISSNNLQDEYFDASLTGRSMEIPIGAYYAKIAGTDIGRMLQPHTKVHAEGMTQAEAQTFNDAWAEAQEVLKSDFEIEQATNKTEAEGSEAIFEDVKQRAMDAGIIPDQAQQYAQLYSTFFRVMAERTKSDPADIYQKYGFEIKRPLPGEKQFIETDAQTLAFEMVRRDQIDGVRKKIEKSLGPSVLDAIRDRGGVLDDGGELAARNLPPRYVAKGDAAVGDLVDGKQAGSNVDRSIDGTALAMWEGGYFPELTERPTPDDLLGAIDEELSGRKRFVADANSDAETDRLIGLVQFADQLDELGLDPKTMTDVELTQAIEKISNSDAETNALFQEASAVDTPEFKKWFGDSKAVDADGAPLVLHHGGFGIGNIERFDKDFAGDTTANNEAGAFHFVVDSDVSDDYARQSFNRRFQDDPEGLIEAGIVSELPEFDGYEDQYEFVDNLALENIETQSVYLKIENPIEIDMRGERIDVIKVEEIRMAIANGFDETGVLEEFSDGPTEKFIESDIEDYKSEIDEYIKDNHDVERSEAEDWQVDEAVREVLYDNGIEPEFEKFDGVIIRNMVDDISENSNIVTDQYIVFEPEQVKSINNSGAFDENDARLLFQEKRGSIQLQDGRTIINLFEQADLSTFLHESGHFFLEVMRDLADASTVAEVGPPTQLQSDWAAVSEYLGIDGADIPVDAHEKFARSFERYLFEGKAPSQEVAGIMARFRSWLVFVYKQVSQLNAPISDEMRRVFDRMLATDREIKNIGSTSEFRPAFRDAAEAGMTDAQWADYTETAARAVEKAKSELDVKMMEEISRETTSEWKRNRKEIEKRVRDELEQVPVHRLMAYLRTGKSDDVPAGMGRMVLNAGQIEDVLGDGALNKMPRAVPPVYSRKGGVHPDILAEFFGFQSGHEMLRTMVSADGLKQSIKDETDLRMRNQYGDLMGDAVARAREVEASIANDATGELLEAEMKVLLKKGLVTTAINRRDAQRAAKEMVRGKTIREAVRLRLYMNANRKAAAEAEKAILAQDWGKAIEAKKRQMLNHYMAIEAREVEKETEAAVKYIGKFTGRKRPKNIDADYVDQIEGLLERFDFRKSISLKEGQRRASLADWIAQQEELGGIVMIPDALRDDAFRKPYKTMTVDDLLALRDTVKNIEHLGRLKDQLLANKKQREFEAVRDDMVQSIQASQKAKPVDKTRNPTKIDQALSMFKSMESALLKMEQVFNWMDSNDINGPLRRNVWQPIADAEVKENDMRITFTSKLSDVMGELDSTRLAERITIPGLDQTYLRSEIMAVALNMGNESNLDKMIRGEAWTPDVLDRVVSHLNADEWQAVQKLWDTVHELWPEVAALQKRLTGVEPPKVEAREVETPFGKLKGGYYPVMYDPNRSHDVDDRSAASADKLFENTYLRPETRHGFTNAREQAYTRPLLFDLDGAARHITEVIHDVTHREAIMDAHKLLTNSVTRTEIEKTYGPEIYKQITPWLQSIAHDAYKDDGLGAVDRAFKSIRTRSTMMGMGFRISTMLTQLAGYVSALEMLDKRAFAGAMKDFVRNPLEMWEKVNEMSGEMRHRSNNIDRDAREQIRKASGQSGWTDEARRFAFAGIGFLDKVVTVPSFMAAYNKHLLDYPGDVEGAIATGDRMVRLTQGAGSPKDLVAMQRNNQLAKLVTMFYSYFSAYYNRQRNWGRDAKRAIESKEVGALPELLARQVFLTIGPALVSELLVGRGPSEEDDEGWAEWALRKSLFYPIAAVPVVRDAVGVFDRGFGYSFTPAQQTIDAVIIKPIELATKAYEGELEARGAVKQLIRTTGYATKLPLGQLSSTVDNVWKAIEEDDFQLRDLVLTRNK